MDALTTARLLVAEFHVASQEPPPARSLVKHSSTGSSTTASHGSGAAKPVEKKKSWLGRSRKKPITSGETGAKAHEAGEGENRPLERIDEDGSRETIRGLRKWLVVLCSQQQLGDNHALKITTTCRMLLDAAREQFDALVDATKLEASEEARQNKRANAGLWNKLTLKSGATSANGNDDMPDEAVSDLDDPSLALNALSEILAVPQVATILPMTFVESIIALCFDELNCSLASMPERRAAATRCLSVLSGNPEAFTSLCQGIIKAVQNPKVPSLPRHYHRLRFGFGTPTHTANTLKVFSLVIASLPKLEADRTESCLLVSAILHSANGFGGNAFTALLDKKQQDQFAADARVWCETLVKWSKKRLEPVKQINSSLAIGISIWAGLCSEGKDKELSEVVDIRKFLVTDKIVSFLKTPEDVPMALKLIRTLLDSEAQWELYRNSEAWQAQTLGKLMPAVFKYASPNHDVTNLLVECILVQPDAVLDDWLFAKEQINTLGGGLVAMRALALALGKGGFEVSSSTRKKLLEKHVWPLLASASETGTQTVAQPQADDADESKEEADEDLGISESLLTPWLEKERAMQSRAGSQTSTGAEQQALHALKSAPYLVSPRFSESQLLVLAHIAVVHPHRSLASQAAELLRGLEHREEVVRALTEVLSAADRDSPRTREGLTLLTELASENANVSDNLMTMSLGVARFHRLASLERVAAEGTVDLGEDILHSELREQVRSIARARLRPLLRAAHKLKPKKHSGEVAACLSALLCCSRPTEKAELEAVFSSILIEAVNAPNWVFNRFLWAIRIALPVSCHAIVCDAIKTRLTMPDESFGPMHPRCALLLWAVLCNEPSTSALSPETRYEDSRWAVLDSVVPKILALPANPLMGPAQTESQTRAILGICGKYFACAPKPTENICVERCVQMLTGCGRLSSPLERYKLQVMAGLCKSVDLPEKTRNSFLEYAAGWWNQVSVSDDSVDFSRAKSVLLAVLARNPETLFSGYVERSLRDSGPVGALHFATLLDLVDGLDGPPTYKPATALLMLAALAQRRSPYDGVARLIEKFASWKKDLTRDKRVLLALLSAEEVRDYGDTGVAFLAARACAALGNDLFVDPVEVIAQGAKLCTKLATESAIRVVLIVLEPWIMQLDHKSPEMLTAIFELSELALATSSALRYLVLGVWRACARSCSIHETLFPFLWGKATPLALQAWRAALEHAEAEPVVRAVLEKVNVIPVEQQSSDRVSSVRVEMVLAAVRYADALKASESSPELLSSVLGHLAHLACVTESIPAMRVLLRFAREKPTSQDMQGMRKQVLAAVTLDQPVMEAACVSAVGWVAAEGSNRALAFASALFIFELHNAQPAGTRRSCVGKGALVQIARCAVDQLRSSLARPGTSSTGEVPGALIMRELLRFGSCVDLEADWEAQSVICGLAGACLHPSDLDLQLEASLVLRRLGGKNERAQSRMWFVECAQESGAEEEDALIQFVAGSERLGVEEIHRVVSGVTDSSRPSESFRALCTLMDVPGSGTFTAGDAFFDVLSAVMQWENASAHTHALEVLSERVSELKLASPVVACRAVRCAMNEFVHGLAGSESDKVLSRLAEVILLQTVGLDDGISPVPGPLSALFIVNTETLLRVVERLVDDPTSTNPPVPRSRREDQATAAPPIPPSRPQSEEEQAALHAEEEKTERKIPAQSMEAVEELEVIETLELERLVSVSNVDLEIVETLPIPPEQRRKQVESSTTRMTSGRSDEEFDRKRKMAMLPIAVEKPPSRPPTDTSKPVSMDDIVKQAPAALAAPVPHPLVFEEPRLAAKPKLSPLDTVHEELPSRPTLATTGSASAPPPAPRLLSPRSPQNDGGSFFETNHGGSRFETRRSTLDSKRSSSYESLAGLVKRDTHEKLRPMSPPPAAATKLPLRERPMSPQSHPERTKSPEPPKKSGSLEKVPVLGATPLSPTAKSEQMPTAVGARRSSLEKATPPVIAAPKPEPALAASTVPPRRSSLENILKNGAVEDAPALVQPPKPAPAPAIPARSAANGRQALPGMAELSQLKHGKARAGENGGEEGKKDTKLEHHSLERPLIPVGKRRRPTVTSQASSSSSTL